MYDAAGGLDGLLRLAEAWHRRVLADEVVSHAFSHGYRADHSERLAAYWAEALGGPPLYTGVFGDETAVVRMHSGNGPHEEMDRRAIACFDQALVDVGLDERTRAALSDYFAWATTHGWPPTTSRRRTCPTACRSRAGPGRDASASRPGLADAEEVVVGELAAVQGEPVDPGGYYLVDRAKADAVMRPSATVNAAPASL